MAVVLYGAIPGIITVGGWFELFFVNTLGMPFNTGEIVYIALLVAIVIWAIYETYTDRSTMRQNIAFVASVGLLGIPFYGYGIMAFITGIVVLAGLWFLVNWKRKGVLLLSARVKNTALLCMLMIMIGFSTYAVIVIRSAANPPMDQNSPEDIFTLGNYFSRDQYGDTPLFYGQAYTSEPAIAEDGMHYAMTEGAPIYQRKEKANPDEKDSYYLVRHKSKYIYAQNMFFPRMHSSAHAAQYESWLGGVKGHDVDGVKMPTQWENLKFFLSYQCNFMYWRYFMWNFAGRQNDIQGNGELENGNWITGIPFIDNLMYGDQSLLPDVLKENKGHNVFYCLPLLLGLIGLFWQAWRGRRGIQQFWVVFFLFFMTGLAIVLYLNQTPSQPRERDYAYAGSFYAFAIWCGLGVAALIDWVKKLKVNGTVAAIAISVLTLLVPIQMASQTWDDHDRSGRYTCRDFGQNYLMSMQQKGNPIIYTNGDNDTFPLWYNQEVEGVRTDARVCNLSYLVTDWYIDQMKRPAYDSPSLPISWPRLDYVSGTNEYIRVVPEQEKDLLDYYKSDPEAARQQFGDEPFELKNVLKYWVRNSDPQLHFIPTDTLYVTIDKDAVRRSGMMMASDSIPDRMVISLKDKDALYKGDLMMLEMIANANWTRPIYVALTVGAENYMNLGDNFIQEGLVNRITPFTTRNAKNFDTEKTYEAVMKRFKWGGLSAKGLYIDETVMRMCYTHRRLMAELAMHLVSEGKLNKALNVLQKCEKEIPSYNVPMTYLSGAADMATAYGLLGKKARAFSIYDELWKTSTQYVNYYLSLSPRGFAMSQSSCLMQFQIMLAIIQQADSVDESWADKHEDQLEQLINRYKQLGGDMPQYE